MNNQVAKQCNCADQQHTQGNPVGALLHTSNCGGLGNGSFTMAFSQSQSGIAFASGVSRVWGYQNSVNTSSSEIIATDSSSVQTAGSWCCPGSMVASFGNDGERESGCEFDYAQPANLNGSEWVVNSDSFSGENHLWANNEQPQDAKHGSGIHDADKSVIESTCDVEADSSHATDQKNNAEVNPGGSGSINVSLRHVNHVTSEIFENLSYLLAKKGN